MPVPNSTARRSINEGFNAIAPLMGPVGTQSTSIYTQYACTEPVRKSLGTMMLAIVVADLVFLQAAWKILVWVLDYLVTRRNVTALYCQGRTEKVYESVVMQDLVSNKGSELHLPGSNSSSTKQLIDEEQRRPLQDLQRL